MRFCVLLFAAVALTAPVFAQSTYVGASLVVDIERVRHIDHDSDVIPGGRGVHPGSKQPRIYGSNHPDLPADLGARL